MINYELYRTFAAEVIYGRRFPGRVRCWDQVMYQRNHSRIFYLFYGIFIIYCSMMLLSVTSYCGKSNDGIGSSFHWVHPSFSAVGGHDLSFLSTVHIKLAYIILISFVYRQFSGGLHLKLRKHYKLRKFTLANIFFGENTSRCKQIVSKLLIAILTLNFLLIAIANPSMLNPGPQNFSV